MITNVYGEMATLKWDPHEWLAATILLQARRDFHDGKTICNWFVSEDRITYAEDVEEFMKCDFFFDICSSLDISAEALTVSIRGAVDENDAEDFDEV